MAIKFTANATLGVPFDNGETRNVDIANEALDKASGFEGETVVYTVDMGDSTGNALPVTFLVDLKINGTALIAGQALNGTVYNPTTFKLTLPWVVPAAIGSFAVKLEWAEQVI